MNATVENITRKMSVSFNQVFDIGNRKGTRLAFPDAGRFADQPETLFGCFRVPPQRDYLCDWVYPVFFQGHLMPAKIVRAGKKNDDDAEIHVEFKVMRDYFLHVEAPDVLVPLPVYLTLDQAIGVPRKTLYDFDDLGGIKVVHPAD